MYWLIHICAFDLDCRYLDRLVAALEEKKHHEVKLKDGLKDVASRRMELQNSLSSSWPKQVSFFICFCILCNSSLLTRVLLFNHLKTKTS